MENESEPTPFYKKTSTFLKVVTIGFACLEILGVVVLQFANQCELWESYPNTLSVCNFGGWQLAEKEEISSVLRQLTFFSLYVGNNKLMMALLSIVCAFSTDERTKQLVGVVGTLGTAAYFVNMNPLMKLMLTEKEVSPILVNSTFWTILVLFVLNFSATAAYTVAIKGKNTAATKGNKDN